MQSSNVISISSEQELRVYCGTDCVVQLANGLGDIFGWPLPSGHDVYIPAGRSVAITTPQTATVRVTGIFKTSTSDNFMRRTYGDLMAKLDIQRERHLVPRILVCGTTDTGKSTLCTVLCNSAVRKGCGMVYVDGDLGQGSVTIPGTISAVFVDDFVHYGDGFARATPLCYFFGDTTLNAATLPRYGALCGSLRKAVDYVSKSRPEVPCGGVVINTMGWIVNEGYETIKMLIRAFDVNVVLALGDTTKLVEDLRKDFTDAKQSGALEILQFPVAPGVSVRDRTYRAHARAQRVHNYFHGARPGDFTPHRTTLPLKDLKFYWACPQLTKTDQTLMPSVAATAVDVKDRKKMAGGYVFAVVNALKEEDAVLGANVAGFGAVLDVDPAAGEVEVLLPNAYALPSPYLLVSRTTKYEPKSK